MVELAFREGYENRVNPRVQRHMLAIRSGVQRPPTRRERPYRIRIPPTVAKCDELFRRTDTQCFITGKYRVGSFCCPALPEPLESLLLPGGSDRVLFG